ncbi:MAG: 30S ribosomal protein S12 methylthiotransferase RimO, partial [Deltaproteobacteria bacterium]|nr:30S ribosomal protein S12 methylthiotransferase RimO [Deltaproteobacteria bacterium]
IEEILRAAAWKKTGRCRHLVVTGCLPQRYGKSLAAELPEVDIFLDTNEAPHITGHLEKLRDRQNTAPLTVIANPTFLMNADLTRLLSTPAYSAYLKVAEGCSNYCSYCIIPALRGKARSRPIDDIVKEAETLAAQGVREIIITAQDTTAFGRDLKGHPHLSELLQNLAAVDQLRWIRLLYTYPGKLDKRTLTVMAGEEKICPYVDIPIQHIDDDILKAMHRKGGSAQIGESIALARKLIPDLALRTSLIVGFPGETPARFQRLLNFIVETRFDHLGVFKYSREEETAAAILPGHVSEKTKERRRQRLMEEQATVSSAINQTLIGSRQEVLIEGASDIPDYPFIGRCRRQAPEIDGITYVKGQQLTAGDFVSCTVTGADTYDLYAEA